MGKRLEKFLNKVSSWFPERTITGKNAEDVYLRRFYICGPLDRADLYRPQAKERLPWLPFTIFLHFFERGDEDRALHNHPWEWCLSWILVNGYVEFFRVNNFYVPRTIKPGKLHFFRANHFHRVILRGGGIKKCWTLFIAGPRVQTWGFWDPVTHEYKDQSVFFEEKVRSETEKSTERIV